uniref:CSON011029 protein n=1 Tax=Culicoides sonorensis TaxID=179676 RepID=A0A336N1C5_CULSO
MKFLYILGFVSILIVNVTARDDTIDGLIEDILNQKVEEFREIMRTGDPEKGIPVLAPFETDYMENSFSFEGIISWSGVFKNLKVENMDNFINHKLTFSLLTMRSKFNFTLPDIIAQGFQDIRGHVFTVLPHWAYGNFRIAPTNVRFFGDAKLSINRDGFLNMDRLTASLYLDEFNSRMDNLLTGGDLSELLNRVIPDIVPSSLDNFPDRVTAKLEKKMLPVINMFLNTINIKEIMQAYNAKNFN